MKNMYQLYHDDCLKILPTIETGSVDLICCDLPYGVTANKADIVIPFDQLWAQYERVIKDNGAIVLFAQGRFYVDLVNSNRKLFRYDLVWDKELTTGFLNANRMPLRRHEQIAVFYKKLPTYNPQMVEGRPLISNGFSASCNTGRNYGYFEKKNPSQRLGTTEKYPTSILKFQKPHSLTSHHRTEKPVDLLKWIIKTYTNEGETVLDNCMGAGSCGIAAVECGRDFIGIEKDPEYFEVAEGRIKEAKRKADEAYHHHTLASVLE